MPNLATLILPLTLIVVFLAQSSANVFNIMHFGARPDAITDSSAALLEAWSLACASAMPSTVFVPPGRFLLRNVLLQGPCRNPAMAVRIFGTLLAPADYNAIGDKGTWLHFEGLDGLSVLGGTIDGRGAALWDCKKTRRNCPSGATNLGVTKSKNVMIAGVTSLNSQMFHIVIHSSDGVRLRGISVEAAGDSPNTDGIHVQLSGDVSIFNTRIGTGDDCISIGPGTDRLFIHNVACGPGHGISIGSLGKSYEEPGVQNITVENVAFKETQNGVRIKTWGRPSRGFVRGVVFHHATMSDVRYPIVIDQNYCPDNRNCPGQVSGVKISDVRYEDIRGTSASEVAVKFDCSKANPCEGIEMENVNLSYMNRPARASCSNAAGSASGLINPTSCLD
ncbi:polygalacturonase-like [Andrographis paniculata]|uniref:polygalacturonase-like n=1 Tax=Andrographis paniculata TaxID=175694 RepID=UPI0021E79A82|nr:polygalacturonase-like [Andrographis paniculata]